MSAQPQSATFARFAVSPARRRKDRLMRGMILAATMIALVPLALVIYYLLKEGLGAWSGSFFTTDPTGNTFFKTSSIGGIKSAILGTIEIVALATPSRCGWSNTAARALLHTSCASSSTCSRACRRSSLACSSTSC
jgi:hypothetical protein